MHRTYSESFDDLFITTIGPDTAKENEYWAIILNFQYTPVGGCQQQVKGDDEVLFALVNTRTTRYYLKIDGPTGASVNETVVLTVTDGITEDLIEGAVISYGGVSYKSDALGQVSLSFEEAGCVQVKAEKAADSVRSNLFSIDVT